MGDIITIDKFSGKKVKILIAPLDWGLGHTTRCIQIIKELLSYDYELFIACEGQQMQLLRNEFPALSYIYLPGYGIRYGKNSWLTVLKIVLQIPKILIQINSEHRWLDRIIAKENIDCVISDNRFGLHSKKIISVFVTHQLTIKTPFGKAFERVLQKLNYRSINKFSVCWVPDFQKENTLAGELSNPKKIPDIPIRYIGLLSRFEKKETPVVYKLMLLLSGPEPQRTILENIFLQELKLYNEKTILIRGLPSETKTICVSPNVEIHNHLSSSDMCHAIGCSQLVICRSGYSTIMELARLGKKSIMIPTPGQSEQEYLADYLCQKRWTLKINQKDFSLANALTAANNFTFENYEEKANMLLRSAIDELQLKKKQENKNQLSSPSLG